MMRKYAMYFAFENSRVDDYVTEKLWNTFKAGVLPVYFGAPNIREHVPERSIVHVDDFESEDALALHLKEILANETLYESYHAWRYKPLPKWFVRKYNFTHVHSECRTCRWAAAKLQGLPWDHEQQQVRHVTCEHALEPYETSKGCSTSATHCLRETDIPCCQNIGFRTLEKIVRVLEANDIKYSLMYGTLLAAARDTFLQPFDNRDMDIAIPTSKMPLLLKHLDLTPWRSGSVTSFRDESYKIEQTKTGGAYCVHEGEQKWTPSYRHDMSLFKEPPYVDVYVLPDREFGQFTTLELGTLSITPKKWPVLANWRRRLDAKYPNWIQRPTWISPEQYRYHGWPEKQDSDILWVIPAFKRAS